MMIRRHSPPAFLLATGLGCALSLSCSNDPVAPSHGGAGSSAYQITVESFSGEFRSVCGSGPNDLYAVGSALMHYDGARWSPLPFPQAEGWRFDDAWCSPEGVLFATDGWHTFRLENGVWSQSDYSNDRIRDLWGTSATDAYALTFEGLRHFNGTKWSNVPLPFEGGFNSISGSGPDDFAIVGYRGFFARYLDGLWTAAELDTFVSYNSVAITSSGRTFVTDYDRIDEIVDSTPHMILDRQNGPPVLCADGDVLYAASQDRDNYRNFVVRRYANDTWSDVAGGEVQIGDFWAKGNEMVIGGRDGVLWQGTAGGNDPVPLYPRRPRIFDAVEIDGAVFTVGQGVSRFENGVWTDLNKEYITNQPGYAIYGRSRDNIYVTGPGMILHYDGNAWAWVNGGFGEDLYSVWVGPDGGVIAAGSNRTIVESDGDQWKHTQVTGGASSFEDVWGIDGRVFAVGYSGLIATRVRDEWILMPPPTDADLRMLWGSDRKHIYAVSSTPRELCFFDGRSWEPMYIHDVNVDRASAIWGTSASNFFVLDYFGTLAHFDGSEWTSHPRIFCEGMGILCGLDKRDLFLSGAAGTLVYRQ